MRLIDAENFSEAIKDYFTDMITNHKYNVNCVDCNSDLQHLLNNQQTAYDIDEIVEELEKEVERWEDSGKEYKDKCEIAVGRGLRIAIEIVKQGDVRKDVNK